MMQLTFASKVTIGRIVLVPFFIVTLLYYTSERDFLRFVALGLFLVAVITDFIDGYIARTLHQKTKTGAILDPLADKILLISAFICLYKMRIYFDVIQFPLWLVIPLIGREIVLILGAMTIQMTTGNFVIEADFLGKATLFFQIICILGMLLQVQASSLVWLMTLVVSAVSGVLYIREGIRVIHGSVY